MGSDRKPEDIATSETLVQEAPSGVERSSPVASVPSEAELLAGRYRVLGLIGRGGMGAVYRALDTELDEVVALKMIRLDAGDSGAVLERFRREVKLARRVTHPNVARMFDIGEHGGSRFLTMELIDGETLTDLVQRSGRLPLGRVLHVASAVCAGLAAAHAAGVVHRDLKPDNVMVAKNGRVVITDFGIARDPVGQSEQHTLGGMVGTPAYMAPEQVEGAADIDARADLYAFGVMLYELLTGELPWKAGSPLALAAARLYAPPPDLAAARPDLPRAVAAVVARCLCRERSDRYASAEELAQALAAASPTLPQDAHATPSVFPPPRPSDTPPSGPRPGQAIKSLAVLPFRNLGPSADQFVADGLTDDLIDTLSMTSGLRVRPRGAVQRFEKASLDPREIGRELDVEVVVEGSVRRLGERVRLTARLTSVEDGFQLWAQRFERPANDLLVVSDETAHAIADALTVRAAKSKHVAPTNPQAVELYLRARLEIRRFGATNVIQSIEMFRAAHELAPDDIAILSGYARACARAWFFQGAAAPGTADRARSLAEQAVRAAPDDPDALLALGTIRLMEQDLAGCAEHTARALRRAPDHAEARELAGRLLLEAGRPDLALDHLARAKELDPSQRPALMETVRALGLLGRFEEALELLDAARASGSPESDAVVRARLALWSPLIQASLLDVVIPADAAPHSPWTMVRLAQSMARGEPAGSGRDELAHFATNIRSSRFNTLICQLVTEIDAHEGRPRDALEWLERAVMVGLNDLAWVDLCPPLAPLRAEPRFRAARETVAERVRPVLEALANV